MYAFARSYLQIVSLIPVVTMSVEVPLGDGCLETDIGGDVVTDVVSVTDDAKVDAVYVDVLIVVVTAMTQRQNMLFRI